MIIIIFFVVIIILTTIDSLFTFSFIFFCIFFQSSLSNTPNLHFHLFFFFSSLLFPPSTPHWQLRSRRGGLLSLWNAGPGSALLSAALVSWRYVKDSTLSSMIYIGWRYIDMYIDKHLYKILLEMFTKNVCYIYNLLQYFAYYKNLQILIRL